MRLLNKEVFLCVMNAGRDQINVPCWWPQEINCQMTYRSINKAVSKDLKPIYWNFLFKMGMYIRLEFQDQFSLILLFNILKSGFLLGFVQMVFQI